MATSGLKSTQLALLQHVVLLEEPTMRTLADELVMDISALGHSLKPLIRDGWIDVAPDSRDGRARRVSLTSTGKIRYNQAMVLWRSAHDRFETAAGESRAAELRAVLDFLYSREFEDRFQQSSRAKGN
ncbi:MarR family winged helix-turn-helix transcriptional regulator [Agrobacterium tumefaciens]|nr:MarR family winged helix-turn-helix transcriptional regulator [Agrobacterium tumefaciens]WCA62392.1 MarR family winged helix-turn-helix transcriptional regulator [Agrobacterium tumefaciens]WIC88599.1 MarR family winged helix-turn-helix transcriptional regulator [Agrobacterium tumefaciens]